MITVACKNGQILRERPEATDNAQVRLMCLPAPAAQSTLNSVEESFDFHVHPRVSRLPDSDGIHPPGAKDVAGLYWISVGGAHPDPTVCVAMVAG